MSKPKLIPINQLSRPAIGERWTCKTFNLEARVMAVAEHHVMYRRTGAMPQCAHIRDWHAKFNPPGPLCSNCETRLPRGCSGLFKHETTCLLHQEKS